MTARSVLTLVLTACTPSPDLERMLDQPRADAFEASDVFEDGATMRHPVAGTVPRSRALGPSEWSLGVDEKGSFVSKIPTQVTKPMLERGRDRYDVFCAPCHGLLGTGDSDVAENMALRKPANLHDRAVLEFPDGRLYSAVDRGYGMMPAYGPYLSVEDRWAVVAYVRALEFSQRVPLAELTPELRREAGGALQ